MGTKHTPNSPVLKGGDNAQYIRVQKGHSLVFWVLASCFVIGIPFLIYYSVSPNHYWHF